MPFRASRLRFPSQPFASRLLAELELGDIAVKVVFAAILTDILHVAFEDREIALDRVAVDGAIFKVQTLAATVAGRAVVREPWSASSPRLSACQ